MIELLATWFCFCVALFYSLKLIIELIQDHRNVKLLCSENTNVGKVFHPNHTAWTLFLISFAWASFGLLVCL